MRGIIALGVMLVASTCLYAQQVANSDFEEWTLTEGSGGFKSYEEPSNGWASGNGAIHIAMGADPVCEKSEDAAQGKYSAKLTTRKIFGQIASGSLYTGKFVLNLSDPVKSALRGIPFTDSPTAFKGWYKYLPTDNDSATLYAVVSYWDGNGRVTIAEARLLVKGTVDSWTEFAIPFTYTSTHAPDTIALVFASSAGGEFFKGSVGSTLYVDGIELTYDPMGVDDKQDHAGLVIEKHHARFLHPCTHVAAYNLQGLVMREWNHATTINLQELSAGVYVLVATLENGGIISKLVVVGDV